MKNVPSLDDLSLFFAVADAGSLSGAASTTGVSVPTLSRRMGHVEQAVGKKLFERGPKGYALTWAGRALASELGDLRRVSAQVQRLGKHNRPTRVRITAGHWTSQFLARHLTRVWSPHAPWVPEFVTSDVKVDIARREADVGVRNARPDQPWLAGQQISAGLTYAPFAAGTDVIGWVAMAEGLATSPSQRWLWDRHGDDIVTTVNDPRLALELALAGVGQVVMPVFAGRMWPDLVQAGDVIPELTHAEWLVSHHDARHDPPVRAAIEALRGLLGDTSLRG